MIRLPFHSWDKWSKNGSHKKGSIILSDKVIRQAQWLGLSLAVWGIEDSQIRLYLLGVMLLTYYKYT